MHISRCFLLFTLALSLTACGDEMVEETGLTGIRLTIRYDKSIGIDQIEVVALSADVVLGTKRIPEEPQPFDVGENTAVILLSEDLGGQTVNLRVNALRGGQIIASATAEAQLVAKMLVDVSVQLAVVDCSEDLDNDGVGDCDDGCIDVDGDGYGSPGAGVTESTCTGQDCDDEAAACTDNCLIDTDADTVPDCADTCLDGDGDNYGTPGGAGDTCDGPDCDDTASTCTTECTTDVDGDGTADCADTCLDADGDNYGEAGGAGNDCAGTDCDDTVASCTDDCTSDLDADGTRDCEDTCIDPDMDGFGTSVTATSTCMGTDCDEMSITCNIDCTTDADVDGTRDCEDTCIDADNDGFGVPGGGGNSCNQIDCNDNAPLCTTDCTQDSDGDGIEDCADDCEDADQDGYGTPGVAGNGCLGTDCNEGVPTCNVDCMTNLDLDALPDCVDDCVDADGDGYGDPGGLPNGCLGTDCDDTSPACTTDCSADLDQDMIVDCADSCVDADGDGYGTAGILPSTCTEVDCDDNAPTCTVDCVTNLDQDGDVDCLDTCIDRDGDGYGDPGGAGNTCTAADCNDARAICTTDCTACLPASLTLTAQSPVGLCLPSDISIDLAGYDGAAGELVCDGTEEIAFGPFPFTNNVAGLWTTVSDPQDVLFDRWNGGFPTPSCNGGGEFIVFETNGGYLELGAPFDARGFGGLRLSFRAGYRDQPDAGDDLEIAACCGAGCNPVAADTIPNANSGGVDTCGLYDVYLPANLDDCGELMIRFTWPASNGAAGIDDVVLRGVPVFAPITEDGGGLYSTSLTSCVANTFDIVCTWDDGANPPLSDGAQVVFQ